MQHFFFSNVRSVRVTIPRMMDVDVDVDVDATNYLCKKTNGTNGVRRRHIELSKWVTRFVFHQNVKTCTVKNAA